ncbi:MAG: PspC domain-containing protein [Bacteroidales bacterium]|nr:PspC domain-containing protein [Bacteroidales bacterium]MCB8998696.1 PspC domain-containing protein [Bacteroidales bacterium]
MKKAVKINMSGQIFHIDEDAYDKLKVYLDTISSHFSNANESKEIISDIEARIAELFRERMSDENQVISIKEVEEVIEIMGRPEEIVDDEEVGSGHRSREQRASRKLYRDPDNAVLGGVCSGLGAYFGIDILLVRILFVVFTLAGGGLPVPLYIILWIAVPKALTAAEKLEMRGEKVTVSNIERTVREEYEDVKENLKKARNSDGFRRTEEGIISVFRIIGTIFLVFFKIILGFIAFVFIMAGIGLLFGTISFLFFGAHFMSFGPHGGFTHTLPELMQPFINPQNATVLILAVMLLVLIPVLAVIYGLFKALFRFKAKDRVLGMSSFAIWILALVTTFMLVYYEGRNYQEGERVGDNKTLSLSGTDTLYLSLDQTELNTVESENHINFDHRWYFSDELDSFYGGVEINVKKSTDGDFRIRTEKMARGRNNEEARKLAQDLVYGYKQKDSALIFDPYFKIDKDGMWRAQSVEITLYVPVGKAVHFDDNMEDFLGWVYNSEDFSHWELEGKTLLMKENGLSMP